MFDALIKEKEWL